MYVPPHARHRLRNRRETKSFSKTGTPPPKGFTKLDYEEDFPTLGSSSKKPEKKETSTPEQKEPKKSFKDIVKNSEIKFDLDILKQKHGEPNPTYYNRLSKIFKNNTTLHKYNIYIVRCKSINKTLKAAARDENIARFLCQQYEISANAARERSEYEKFRADILDQMNTYEDLWEEIMSYVGFDINRSEQAVKMYYNKTMLIHDSLKKQKLSYKWLNSLNTTCTKTEELCISKEKIIH